MIRWIRIHWLLVYFLLGVIAFSIFVSCAAPMPTTNPTPLPTTATDNIVKVHPDPGVTCYIYKLQGWAPSMSCFRGP